MKVSYNWLKDYLDFEETPHELGEILTEIGLEVEGLEKVESIPGGLAGLVSGKVVECEPHPNADRLKVTKVDIGESELLPIVCGAPNVDSGQIVIVATVGAVLHPMEGESFTIKKSKIRGEVSEGMICAEDEIGLGGSHEGILVLDKNVKVGKPASSIFEINTDFVYEIGLTPNRSDATSHLGVARDLAAALSVIHKKNYTVKIPEVILFKHDEIKHDIKVSVEDPELCPRYSSVTISDLQTGPSPKWMAERLKAIGVRPKNNIVDITNFILHELGQPLHAFELRELKGSKVYVKTLPEKTPFVTLDSEKIELKSEDLMICNSEEEPMCLAGVYGGKESGVKDNTRDIFLESAHFSAESVRKSSTVHNLRTDAAKVFEKGSDPSITEYALKRASILLKKYAGGKISSKISDVYPEPIYPTVVKVRLAQIRRIAGFEIPEEEILQILEAMDMEITKRHKDYLNVAVTTDKTDVTREADVIEEILRIYGYNRIPVDGRLSIALNSGKKDHSLIIRDRVSALLTGMGLNEAMALSLVPTVYLPEDQENENVVINNTSNRDLEIMRPDMASSSINIVDYNVKHQIRDLKFYEFGSTYKFSDDKFIEQKHLSISLAGDFVSGSWATDSIKGDFYMLKSVINRVFDALNISGYQVSETDQDRFKYGMKYHRGPRVLAEFGELDYSYFPNIDIDVSHFFGDIHWDEVVRASKPMQEIEPVSRFPVMDRDLALITPTGVSYADIEKVVIKQGKSLIKEVGLFDVYEDPEHLGEGRRSYGIKMVFSDVNKTLSDKEVDAIIQKILNKLQKNYGIELR